MFETEIKVETRAILVCLFLNNDLVKNEEEVKELKALAEAAGANVVYTITQNAKSVTVATYLGSGKVDEIKILADELGANLIVVNDELSGSQIRNLEDIIGQRVIDRTSLILDIFAVRATTPIAKLQVELATHKYNRPRLKGLGESLSRQGSSGGGNVRIGSRGPGEQKLELDRRYIDRRILDIEKQIETYEKTRDIHKDRRQKNNAKTVCLVGYTNAGKSSLMNYLIENTENTENTDKTVFEKDMLFATLDTHSRKIILDDKKTFILVDTVGFVSKLPHALVSAFKSTLEDTKNADLLIQVIDISNGEHEFQQEVTETVLGQIGTGDVPMIKVYNKIDKVDMDIVVDGIKISAKNGIGIDNLLDEIRRAIFADVVSAKFLIPFEKGNISSYLQENYSVELEYTENGTLITGEFSNIDYQKYQEYEIKH